jgi:predicted NUDIX family phosphoesterase
MSEDKYNGEQVLCFPNYMVSSIEGYCPAYEWDAMSRLFTLLGFYDFELRKTAEVSNKFKHVIPYVVFKDRDWIFVYERGSSSGESRLTSKVSIGIGGHINPRDSYPAPGPLQMYRNALMREINEEITIKEPSRDITGYTPPIVGFINDNSNDVGKVHFGVVHLYDCANMTIEPKEDCIKNGKFYSKEKIMSEFGDRIEPWSRMILESL